MLINIEADILLYQAGPLNRNEIGLVVAIHDDFITAMVDDLSTGEELFIHVDRKGIKEDKNGELFVTPNHWSIIKE